MSIVFTVDTVGRSGQPGGKIQNLISVGMLREAEERRHACFGNWRYAMASGLGKIKNILCNTLATHKI